MKNSTMQEILEMVQELTGKECEHHFYDNDQEGIEEYIRIEGDFCTINIDRNFSNDTLDYSVHAKHGYRSQISKNFCKIYGMSESRIEDREIGQTLRNVYEVYRTLFDLVPYLDQPELHEAHTKPAETTESMLDELA